METNHKNKDSTVTRKTDIGLTKMYIDNQSEKENKRILQLF